MTTTITQPKRSKTVDTRPTITTEICEITPDLARDMLGKNTHNRSVREQHVRALAVDMRNGSWSLNGDAIKFDVHGTLLDGQHRLLAVIEADVPVQMLLVWNVDPGAQATYDVGARRNFGDVLTLRGEHSGLLLATIVRFHWMYANGEVQSGTKATHSQLLAHFDRAPESFREAVRLTAQVRACLKYPGSAMGGTLAEIVMKGQHDDDLDDFIDKLKTGAGLGKGNPILTFRAYATNVSSSATKPTPAVLFAIFIKTWNAYIEGRPMQNIAFRAGGVSPEKFPVIL